VDHLDCTVSKAFLKREWEQAVAEKLGFLKEGQIRKVRYYQGQYYDSVKYGILREEWAARA